MKLTPWYPGHIKPVRVGVYERKYFDGVWFCYWDGKNFSIGCAVAEWAKKGNRIHSTDQNLPWRGVAK